MESDLGGGMLSDVWWGFNDVRCWSVRVSVAKERERVERMKVEGKKERERHARPGGRGWRSICVS